MKRREMIGQKFGRLVVIRSAPKEKDGRRTWHVICECGNEKVVRGSHLTQGKIVSCGCYCKEKTSLSNFRHGHSQSFGDSPSYRAWAGMNTRCYNRKDKGYRDYGGRGITVCKRWRRGTPHAFENFLQDVGHRPCAGFSIERVFNDRGYSPGNCTWADRKTQAANRRSNRSITYHGETKLLYHWAKEIGIRGDTLKARLDSNWSIDRAFTTPVRF